MLTGKTLRIARPTDRLDEVVAFYLGLGFTKIGQFEDHAGFDGVMVGMPAVPYHLEFTHHRGHQVGRAPTQDNLLVFYVPSVDEWKGLIIRMQSLGYQPVASYPMAIGWYCKTAAGTARDDPKVRSWISWKPSSIARIRTPGLKYTCRPAG